MDIKTVVNDIYSSCDTENTNLVHASKLIEYIIPFIKDDQSAVETLKAALDPFDENEQISWEKFSEVMSIWAKQIEGVEEDDFNRDPNDLDFINEKELPYKQSTPRESFGMKLLNNSTLFANTSNILETEEEHEKENFQKDKLIKSLQLEICKLKSEDTILRTQLSLLEEQNETLQNELKQANKKDLKYQNVIERLKQDIGKKADHSGDECNELKEKLNIAEKSNLVSQCTINNLEGIIRALDQDKEKLEAKLEEKNKIQDALNSDLTTAKKELEKVELELTKSTQTINFLKGQITDNTDQIKHFKEERKLHLEKISKLEEVLKENISSGPAYARVDSPLKGRNIERFNSPLKCTKHQSPFKEKSNTLLKEVLNSSFHCNNVDASPVLENSILEMSSDDDSFIRYQILQSSNFKSHESLHSELCNVLSLPKEDTLGKKGNFLRIENIGPKQNKPKPGRIDILKTSSPPVSPDSPSIDVDGMKHLQKPKNLFDDFEPDVSYPIPDESKLNEVAIDDYIMEDTDSIFKKSSSPTIFFDFTLRDNLSDEDIEQIFSVLQLTVSIKNDCSEDLCLVQKRTSVSLHKQIMFLIEQILRYMKKSPNFSQNSIEKIISDLEVLKSVFRSCFELAIQYGVSMREKEAAKERKIVFKCIEFLREKKTTRVDCVSNAKKEIEYTERGKNCWKRFLKTIAIFFFVVTLFLFVLFYLDWHCNYICPDCGLLCFIKNQFVKRTHVGRCPI